MTKRSKSPVIYIAGISAAQLLLSRCGAQDVEEADTQRKHLEPMLIAPREGEIPDLDIVRAGFPPGVKTKRLSIVQASSRERSKCQQLLSFTWPVSVSGTYLRVNERYCVLSPEALFVQMANHLALPRMIELGMALCGTYAPGGSDRYTLYGVEPLTTKARIEAYVGNLQGVRGLPKARKALKYLADGSGSEQETKLACFFALEPRLGGAGCAPELNPVLELTEWASAGGMASHRRPDLLWRPERVIVDYDGRAYHDDDDMILSDQRRRNELSAMGYTSFVARWENVCTPESLYAFSRQVTRALGKKRDSEARDLKHMRLELWRCLYGDRQFNPLDMVS